MRVLFSLLVLLSILGCGGSRPPGDVPGVPPLSGAASPPVVLTFAPTATPWPTFTPVPTPTAAPTPTAVPTPVPTSTPWPRTFMESPVSGISRGDISGSGDGSEGPVAVIGENVFLAKQGLVAFRGDELPDYLRSRDWDRMPDSVRVVSTDTRFMLWVVAYDFSQVGYGAELEGFIRWVSIRPDVEPLTMYELPVTLSHDSPFFYHGLGAPEPGLWSRGEYRVEFLDSGYNRVLSAGFEVR